MINFLFLGPTELIIVALLVILLFGGRKIPELMKGIGSGIKGFKDEVKGGNSTKSKPSGKAAKEQLSEK